MDSVKGMLERFATMDRDKDGYVTERDMAVFLGAPENGHLATVFFSLKPVSLLQRKGKDNSLMSGCLPSLSKVLVN